jgi:thioredoxin reductase (NADPH)
MDCLVIGGGPAGLTAAIYLARFRREFRVVDAGDGRALTIPLSHNHAGFPDGVSGPDLVARMKAQAERYGARIQRGEVRALDRNRDGGFVATLADGEALEARTIILATGAEDIEPELPGVENAIKRGLIRHCPICDAYEVIGQKVALVGYGKCRVREALLLRAYTDKLTVLTLGRNLEIKPEERRMLEDAGIRILHEPIAEIGIENDKIATWRTGSGEEHRFDTLYTALGFRMHSDLAAKLGAETDEDGALLVGEHQRTSVPGLYAIGDVVQGLAQISVAMGHAAVAATDINNSLELRRAEACPIP